MTLDPPAGRPESDGSTGSTAEVDGPVLDQPARSDAALDGRARASLSPIGNGHRPTGSIEPGPLEDAPLGAPAIAEGPPPPPTGPPGTSVFSLEGRPAAGLYFASWTLSLLAVVVLFVAVETDVPLARGVLFILGLVILTAGMALGAGYQVLARGRTERAYAGPSPVLLFAIATAAATAVGGLLFGVGAIDTEVPIGFLAAIGVVQAAYIVTIVAFVVRTGALSWRDMGWPPVRSIAARFLSDAGLAVVTMVPTTLVVAIFAGIVARALDVPAPSVLPAARSSADALAVVLSAAVLAPLGEELFFRGFSLTAWQRDLGPRRALIRSSVFFALVHVANVDASDLSTGLRQAALELVVILPVGFVLGWLFQRRGILASIAGHATYNGFLLVLLFAAQRAAPGG